MLLDSTITYTPEQIAGYTHVWASIIQQLSLDHDHKVILAFLAKCAVIEISDKHKSVVIGVPNEFVLTQVKKFFAKGMKNAVHITYNQQFTADCVLYSPFANKASTALHVDIKSLLHVKEAKPTLEETIKIAENGGVVPVALTPETIGIGLPMHLHQTFDTFVSGAHVDFALNAAKAVAQAPGQNYNPLFIYGHVGLGKSHLLFAIAHSIKKSNPQALIAYVPTSKLIDDIVGAIRKNTLAKLISHYTSLDVLLIDDVQFLANKDKTQEIFHNLFNSMHTAGKQIVITSDVAPRELGNIEARLKSRFSLGLVCDVTEPDYETRVAIIQHKLATKNQTLDAEHIALIASTITCNVREIEGLLNILLTRKTLSQADLTLADVQHGLKTLGYKTHPDTATMTRNEVAEHNIYSQAYFAKLVGYVASYYDIGAVDLTSDSRTRTITRARQMLMVIAKQNFQWTYEKIGTYFGGRNHSAVIYAVNDFPKKIKADQTLRHDYNVVLDYMKR